MATIGSVLENALSKVLTQSKDIPFESVDIQASLEELNDMMTDLDATGLPTGYTVSDNVGETITVKDSYLSSIKALLVPRLADIFKRPLTAMQAAAATNAMDSLALQIVKTPKLIFPNTLPIGMGQSCSDSSNFFPGETGDELLTEENGSLLLEDDS